MYHYSTQVDSIMLMAVAHRSQSWVELVVASLLWKLAWRLLMITMKDNDKIKISVSLNDHPILTLRSRRF